MNLVHTRYYRLRFSLLPIPTNDHTGECSCLVSSVHILSATQTDRCCGLGQPIPYTHQQKLQPSQGDRHCSPASPGLSPSSALAVALSSCSLTEEIPRFPIIPSPSPRSRLLVIHPDMTCLQPQHSRAGITALPNTGPLPDLALTSVSKCWELALSGPPPELTHTHMARCVASRFNLVCPQLWLLCSPVGTTA